LETGPVAQELNLAIYKEAILAGAHVTVFNGLPGSEEIRYKYASDEQLDYVSPFIRLITEHISANLYVRVAENTRELTAIDPARMSRARTAMADTERIHRERTAAGEARWCYSLYPTNALAQEADMSLAEYQDFVYQAGRLYEDDPVAAWERMGERQRKLVDWLAGKDQVVIQGSNIDLRLSIQGRPFVESSGKENFPDGEIFTSPVEDSLEGWVRFSYPAIHEDREVDGIELFFEGGQVVKHQVAKGRAYLEEVLASDPGARFVGEWVIGTNHGIRRFTKNILFDEKMGGTMHLALGFGFPEAGGQNQSGIHWDMLVDMAHAEILVDGDLFYKDGEFLV
jgi:aminopeptidase